MMNTPICDFVRSYARTNALRLHMPGHKGEGVLGVEKLDITEIEGADSLYEANGVIRESEENASTLFGCPTFYSTEGSSLCIRAMMYLIRLQAGDKALIWAGRNAHKTFLSAAALLDLDVEWLYPRETGSHLCCLVDAQTLDEMLEKASQKPTAVYLTSPDYLGNVADIRAIAQVCHRHDVLLAVDNAHGAYLRFLPESCHPIDLGADICCDSAHKTLPVLTGGAYLHIAPHAPAFFAARAREALAMFGSTSPSYLIMQSLDAANAYLESYPQRLQAFLPAVDACCVALQQHGYTLLGNEKMKITLDTKAAGYAGQEMAALLLDQQIVCEFADPDYLVLMITPETGAEGLKRLTDALTEIPLREAIGEKPPHLQRPERVMSIRQAMMSMSEMVDVSDCTGRVLATASVGCPPAVPIAVCGERLDAQAAKCFAYYGISRCTVVKE